MIRKTLILSSRLMIVGMVVASGLGVASSSKAAALGPSDPICRAVVIVDRSASVIRAGQANNVMREVRNLPSGINHPKIQVAFWSFAGWSRYVSSDDNDWNINRADQDFNWPRHGYIPTRSIPAATQNSWNNAVNSMNNYRGDTLFKRNTYYDWAFGYTNGGNGNLSSTTYNPRPNAALHAGGANSIPARSDVLVFTSDVEEGEPDQRGNERKIVAEKYLSDPNHPRTIVGAIIPSGRLDTDNNPVNLMVNGNRTDKTNVIRLNANYASFAAKVARLINIGCDYKLTPTIQNVPNRMSPNQPINPVRGNIVNDSLSRKSEATEWHITRVSYPPSTITTRIPFASLDGRSLITANASPCTPVGNPNPPTLNPINNPAWGFSGVTVDCNWRQGNNTNFLSGDSNSTVAFRNMLSRNDTSPSEIGGITCYFLSVKPTGWDEPGWSHSPLQCVMAAKSPVLKITGGDLRAIQGQISVNPGGTLGSWVEYGVFSVGTNSASAIGSAGAYGRNTLTFANHPGATSGNFWSSAQVTSANSLVTTIDGLHNFDTTACSGLLAGGGAKKYLCQGASTPINVQGSNITGQHIIDARGKTVTITGNITYSNDCGSAVEQCTVAKVPQVIILANKIEIDPSVTNVDAWLITQPWGAARSSIVTCRGAVHSSGPNGINTSNCGQPLRVNGPVVTLDLYAYRAGSSAISAINDPVEIFNLRPDAYVWLYTRSGSGLKLHTNAIHELPPRY